MLQPGYDLGFDDLTYLDERYLRDEKNKDFWAWLLAPVPDKGEPWDFKLDTGGPYRLPYGDGASGLLLAGTAATAAFLALNLF